MVLCRETGVGDGVVGYADGVGLEDIPRLFVAQSATLDVIGVVGEVDLRSVVDAAFQLHRFLLAERGEKRRGVLGLRVVHIVRGGYYASPFSRMQDY